MKNIYFYITVSDTPFDLNLKNPTQGAKYVANTSLIGVEETNFEGLNLIVKNSIEKLKETI